MQNIATPDRAIHCEDAYNKKKTYTIGAYLVVGGLDVKVAIIGLFRIDDGSAIQTVGRGGLAVSIVRRAPNDQHLRKIDNAKQTTRGMRSE
jgi:hypothetical protein